MMCERCIAAKERPVNHNRDWHQPKAPPNVCPVCFYRYGRYIPIKAKEPKP